MFVLIFLTPEWTEFYIIHSHYTSKATILDFMKLLKAQDAIKNTPEGCSIIRFKVS